MFLFLMILGSAEFLRMAPVVENLRNLDEVILMRAGPSGI